MKRSLILLAVLAAATSAHADNRRGFYVGGGANYIDLRVSSTINLGDVVEGTQLDSPGSLGVAGIEFYGGYKFSPYIGGELRLGTGLADAAQTTNTYSVQTVDIDGVMTDVTILDSSSTQTFSVGNFVSTYYRVESANQAAKLYGLLGFSSVTVDGEAGNSETYNGLSYGAGIGFALSLRSNLNFEYKRLVDDGDFSFDIMSVSYDFRI